MDDLTLLVRSFHLIARLCCFSIGAVKLYPVLYYQMQRYSNGLRDQRKNIRGEMFFIAAVMVTATVWQIANWEVKIDLSKINGWISFAMTFSIVGMTYFGVKIINFRVQKEKRYGFGENQNMEE